MRASAKSLGPSTKPEPQARTNRNGRARRRGLRTNYQNPLYRSSA